MLLLNSLTGKLTNYFSFKYLYKLITTNLLIILSILLMISYPILSSGCSTEEIDAGRDSNSSDLSESNSDTHYPPDGFITMAIATAPYDSGLLDLLIPPFMEKYGFEVHVLTMGTGPALEAGKNGEVDLLLVNDRESELNMVEEGYFTKRADIMYNNFVIVGPEDDPAGISNITSVIEAFKLIAAGNHPFVSRGDDSGTHRKELTTWEDGGITEKGNQYYESSQAMGDTLRLADELNSYTLTDRGTFIKLQDTLNLVILLDDDPLFLNQYGIMKVNSDKHSHVKQEGAILLIDFFMSPEGQAVIADYNIAGEQLFFPGSGFNN